jgi:hypothetical protein
VTIVAPERGTSGRTNQRRTRHTEDLPFSDGLRMVAGARHLDLDKFQFCDWNHIYVCMELTSSRNDFDTKSSTLTRTIAQSMAADVLVVYHNRNDKSFSQRLGVRFMEYQRDNPHRSWVFGNAQPVSWTNFVVILQDLAISHQERYHMGEPLRLRDGTIMKDYSSPDWLTRLLDGKSTRPVPTAPSIDWQELASELYADDCACQCCGHS